MSQPCARRKARSGIVALEPGRMTRSQSGSSSPGRTSTRLTPGSSFSGSKSSKLAMRGSSGTAMVARPGSRRAEGWASATASSAGSRAAGANHGTRPSARQPLCASMSRMPASNKVGSPRNLLTRKPRTCAASSAAITAFVPTICAITPPRSMSPISTTGIWAARAKPMLAMSPARRFTSAGLPAPSTSTRSASSCSRAKLSSTNSIMRGFSA